MVSLMRSLNISFSVRPFQEKNVQMNKCEHHAVILVKASTLIFMYLRVFVCVCFDDIF